MTIDNKTVMRNLAALVDFSNMINSSLDINFILNNFLLSCFGKFFSSKGLILIIDEENKFTIPTSKGISTDDLKVFQSFTYNDKWHLESSFISLKTKYNFCVEKEIKTADRVIGYLFFNEKLTKMPYTDEDLSFLDTILNIASIAIQNSLTINKLKIVNRTLDAKVNQLASLFDLSKEFGGILDESMVAKLLSFSLIGQLFVTKYAILLKSDKLKILESKFDKYKLHISFKNYDFGKVETIKKSYELENDYDVCSLGVEIIIPMQIKNKTIGLILLGKKMSSVEFSKSELEYAYALASLAAISFENASLFIETLEKEKLEKDLELAKKIQKNLLPQKIPQLTNLEIATLNIPARQVGGDYYDLVLLSNDNLLFAIGDVSGKGVQAALMMANTQAFLKSICKQNLPLDKATNLLNNLISENTANGGFVTFFWGIFNNESRELIYVNAGHNPPLLVRDSSISYLKKGGMILGVMETLIPYEMTKINLQKDDLIVLFTDGITEAMNNNKEEYTDERLEKIVIENSNISANDLIDIIIRDVNYFTDSAEQSDDITSLILKVK